MPLHRTTSRRAQATKTAIYVATLTIGAALAALGTVVAQAQDRDQRRDQQRVQAQDFGQREFNANCAACHGMDAKGRGPVAGFLTKNPPDLTTVAKRNGGVFPMERLYRVVDGTELPEGAQAAGPHGNREMPIWGRDYSCLFNTPDAAEE